MEEFGKSSSFDDVQIEKTNVDIKCKGEDNDEIPNVNVKTDPEVGWPESSTHNDTVTNTENDDNSQSADIKHESTFQDNDTNKTEEGVRRWTVWSSTLMPLVKTEESSILDHGDIGFESTTLFSSNDSRTDGSTGDICRLGFSAASNLTKQSDSLSGKKSYGCDVCGKHFSTPYKLTIHNRSHTGEKPFKCDICNQVFSMSYYLTRHKLIHIGKKPHMCDMCGKSFKSAQGLAQHHRSHTGETPYKCDVCHKEFSVLYNLTTHQRIHTGEKPYKCDACQKKFNHLSTLKAHQRIHTAETPYKCDICNKVFTNSSHLSRHKRIHKCDV